MDILSKVAVSKGHNVVVKGGDEMGEFYREKLAVIYNGDARSMTELPDNYVHVAVTSPP